MTRANTRRRALIKPPARSLESETSRAHLSQTLGRQPKSALVQFLVQFARESRPTYRYLAAHFELDLPPEALVTMTCEAIADATAFDEKHIACNFPYDSAAYETVQRNLKRLIELGHLHACMELCLHLMDKGSRQAEMSDEALMSEEIEACLRVVLEALETEALSASEVIEWCERMMKLDRLECLCRAEILALRQQFPAAAEHFDSGRETGHFIE